MKECGVALQDGKRKKKRKENGKDETVFLILHQLSRLQKLASERPKRRRKC